MSIRLNAGDDVKEYLIEKGYDEKYGARPLKRTIQNLVEDKLAEAVLEGKVKEGDSVKISVKEGQQLEMAVQKDNAKSDAVYHKHKKRGENHGIYFIPK